MIDRKPDCGCRQDALPEPDVNYLAKDYASFRQLILDRLAILMPDWRERHVPDLGIALVELLAYVGDYLSYYQDGLPPRPISIRRASASRFGDTLAWSTTSCTKATTLGPG